MKWRGMSERHRNKPQFTYHEAYHLKSSWKTKTSANSNKVGMLKMKRKSRVSTKSVTRAFRAAKFSQTMGKPAGIIILVLILAGILIHQIFAILAVFFFFIVVQTATLIVPILARCPNCKVKWWNNSLLEHTTGNWLRKAIDPYCTGNETIDLQCRKCGLKIDEYLESTEQSSAPYSGSKEEQGKEVKGI